MMRTVSVDVDIDEFGTHDLIEELCDRGVITKKEKTALLARKEKEKWASAEQREIDNAAQEEADRQRALVEDASWRARRREFGEALHCIALAFPSLSALEGACAQG